MHFRFDPIFRAWILGKDNLRVRVRTLYKIQSQPVYSFGVNIFQTYNSMSQT